MTAVVRGQQEGADWVQSVLDVLSEVRFSTKYWRELGSRLKPNLNMDDIEADHSQDTTRCLEVVIERWYHDGDDPSWETLADAVSKCRKGGGKNMAAKIRKKVGLASPVVPTKPDSQLQSATTAPSIPSSSRPNVRQGQGMEVRQKITDSEMPPVLTFFSEKEVQSEVRDLSDRFNGMVADASEALEKSEMPPEKVSKKAIFFLKMPDPYFKTRDEHMEFLDTLNTAADVLDLFTALNSYWDHFNYHLLERLIMAPRIEKMIGDKETWQQLQVDMKQYVQDMDVFRRRTTLGVYYKVFDKQKKVVPESFQELVTKHEWSEANTLQDVEDFRQRVALKYQLHNCLVFFKNFVFSSVVITWWIPRSLVATHPLPEGGLFDDQGGVLMVSLDGTVIWIAESQVTKDPTIESEPEVLEEPLVQETATESEVVKSKESVLSTVWNTVSGLLGTPTSVLSAVRSQNAKEVERLIAEGHDPNLPNAVGWTPLMEASAWGYTLIAQLLLEKGAKPNLANYEGWTALMAASRNGHLNIVDQLLVHGADLDMRDCSGWSALMATVYNSHEAISLKLIEAGATPHLQEKVRDTPGGTNAIFLAIILEQPKVIDALLAREPDLNMQDKYGETVLITACKKGNLKVVQDLLERNADPNILNNDEDSPLLLAIEQQDIEIIKVLLKYGAKPHEGAIPALHLASSMGVIDIVRELLSYKANPAMQDKYGTTAYEVASWKKYTEVAQMIAPEQSTEPRSPELLESTLQGLSTLHTQFSRAPLYYLREAKFKAMRTSWIRKLLPRDILQ